MQSFARSVEIAWIPVTMRWLVLVGAGIWLAFEGQNLGVVAAILLGVAGNLAALLLILGHFSQTHLFRLASWLLDIILAQMLLYFGHNHLGLAWVAALPVITGALYYSWIGAGLSALLNGLLTFGIQALQNIPDIILPIALVVGSLLVGLPVAFLARRSPQLGLKAAREVLQKKEAGRRSTIFDMISVLNTSLNYQRVLESALDVSAQTLESLEAPQIDQWIGAVLLFTDTGGPAPVLKITTSRNLLPMDREVSLPGASGLLAQAIDEGTPQLNRAVSADPELAPLTSLARAKSAYVIPLRTGLDAYGLLLFAHPQVDFFTADRREVLDIVGRQAVVAIQNARLYQDLEQEKNRLTEVQEESRKKLARDLHDGPTQSISAIAMRVNFARRLLERDVKASADELYKIEDLARRTTKEIRHMLFTLRPLVLESQGLAAAFESMAEKMKETFNQEVLVQVDNHVVDALDPSKHAVVFYIAEEAVNNARKHAKAQHIWVRLKMLRDELCMLEIEDDGVGFDTQAVNASYESRGSLGMVNLRERTDLVSGVLRIDSAPGKGTRVQVVIPLTEDAADRIRQGA